MTDLRQEKQIRKELKAMGQENTYVAGCDEAGRGAYAGPVIAAAVILPADVDLPGITDSKKVSKNNHIRYSKMIMDKALAIGIGVVEAIDIDRYGVGEANKQAIQRAVEDLPITPAHILIDGNSQQKIVSDIPQTQVIKGDMHSLTMASASIIAKTMRDSYMKKLGKKYPEYDWENNAGYGTNSHQQAIETFGITDQHRKSFKPIREHIQKQQLSSGVIG